MPELRRSAWWGWDGNGVLGAEWKQPYTLSGHFANYSHYAQLSVAALLHEVDDGGNEQDYAALEGMIDAQRSSSDLVFPPIKKDWTWLVQSYSAKASGRTAHTSARA